jgi:hypothetical protein
MLASCCRLSCSAEDNLNQRRCRLRNLTRPIQHAAKTAGKSRTILPRSILLTSTVVTNSVIDGRRSTMIIVDPPSFLLVVLLALPTISWSSVLITADLEFTVSVLADPSHLLWWTNGFSVLHTFTLPKRGTHAALQCSHTQPA